jgi:hypothetical protein
MNKTGDFFTINLDGYVSADSVTGRKKGTLK